MEPASHLHGVVGIMLWTLPECHTGSEAGLGRIGEHVGPGFLAPSEPGE